MKSGKLQNMGIDALLELRDSVDAALSSAGKIVQDQLARVGVGVARKPGRKRRNIAPKYRGPKGETWAGRGLRPRWLTALVKQGHTIEQFSVDKQAGGKRRKKARKKRKG